MYLLASVNAASDSEEWPPHHIRGKRGLLKQVEEISNSTGGTLDALAPD